MAGHSNRTWTCPFFGWDEKRKIHCEGGCVVFPDRKTFAEYTGEYCACTTGWEGCTMAKSLLNYYERTE